MSNELTALTSLPVSPVQRNLAKYANQTEYLKRLQLVTKGRYVAAAPLQKAPIAEVPSFTSLCLVLAITPVLSLFSYPIFASV